MRHARHARLPGSCARRARGARGAAEGADRQDAMGRQLQTLKSKLRRRCGFANAQMELPSAIIRGRDSHVGTQGHRWSCWMRKRGSQRRRAAASAAGPLLTRGAAAVAATARRVGGVAHRANAANAAAKAEAAVRSVVRQTSCVDRRRLSHDDVQHCAGAQEEQSALDCASTHPAQPSVSLPVRTPRARKASPSRSDCVVFSGRHRPALDTSTLAR